jgi:hypothetical protein
LVQTLGAANNLTRVAERLNILVLDRTVLLSKRFSQAACLGVFVALAGCVAGGAPEAPRKTQSVPTMPPAGAPSARAELKYAAEPTRSEVKAVLTVGQALQIQNDFGDVRLRFGGFEHGVLVTAVAQAPIGSAMPVVGFDQASGIVRTALPDARAAVLGQRIDLVVWAPEKHNIKVNTLRGLVEIRGVHSDVTVRSSSGDITARGVQGALDIETGSGAIEAAFSDHAIAAVQRAVTRTGAIVVSFGPKLNAELALATSALIATEYSVEITQKPGEEPNKTGVVKIGVGKNGLAANKIEISSKRGELRLFRRQAFVEGG